MSLAASSRSLDEEARLESRIVHCIGDDVVSSPLLCVERIPKLGHSPTSIQMSGNRGQIEGCVSISGREFLGRVVGEAEFIHRSSMILEQLVKMVESCIHSLVVTIRFLLLSLSMTDVGVEGIDHVSQELHKQGIGIGRSAEYENVSEVASDLTRIVEGGDLSQGSNELILRVQDSESRCSFVDRVVWWMTFDVAEVSEVLGWHDLEIVTM